MPRKKITKAEKKRRDLAAWHRRYYWPAIIVGVDPGRQSGATVFVSRRRTLKPIVSASVDTHSRDIESILEEAVDLAKDEKLPVVLMMESWGKGGPLGIEQWIGLGEARGIWRRAFTLAMKDADPLRVGPVKLFSPSRVGYVNQRSWRSRMIEETGGTDARGKWIPFDSDGWKDAAIREVCRRTGWSPDRITGDDAESFLVGSYAAQSDALGKMLPKTHLARYGLTFPPAPAPEPGKPRIRKKRR